MSENCKNCLYPSVLPDANVDQRGVCGHCRDQVLVDLDVERDARHARERDLESALQDCRGRGEYDCLLNLSGGKDSCYLLYKLRKEYGLKVLAFTTDMNVPDVAWRNIRRTVDALDVDHLVYRPPRGFYRKMFRYLLQNQEERGAVRSVCYVCAPLFEGYSLKVAVEKRIPLVLAGYSPGQPEPDRMTYEYSPEFVCETDWTPPELRESGLFDEAELQLFWNPLRYPAGTPMPRYLAPFHAWEYSQEETMRTVVELGLIANRRHASPVHSNCPVNWLLMYSDLKNLGFNPYQPEFSKLIREGKANRWYWRVMLPVVNTMIRTRTFLGRNVTRSMDWLGLSDSDLRITRPAAPSVSTTADEPQQTVCAEEGGR